MLSSLRRGLPSESRTSMLKLGIRYKDASELRLPSHDDPFNRPSRQRHGRDGSVYVWCGVPPSRWMSPSFGSLLLLFFFSSSSFLSYPHQYLNLPLLVLVQFGKQLRVGTRRRGDFRTRCMKHYAQLLFLTVPLRYLCMHPSSSVCPCLSVLPELGTRLAQATQGIQGGKPYLFSLFLPCSLSLRYPCFTSLRILLFCLLCSLLLLWERADLVVFVLWGLSRRSIGRSCGLRTGF